MRIRIHSPGGNTTYNSLLKYLSVCRYRTVAIKYWYWAADFVTDAKNYGGIHDSIVRYLLLISIIIFDELRATLEQN